MTLFRSECVFAIECLLVSLPPPVLSWLFLWAWDQWKSLGWVGFRKDPKWLEVIANRL